MQDSSTTIALIIAGPLVLALGVATLLLPSGRNGSFVFEARDGVDGTLSAILVYAFVVGLCSVAAVIHLSERRTVHVLAWLAFVIEIALLWGMSRWWASGLQA